ncbi:MAG: acyltransferase family protein [Betaproteobacteria bacterium]
MPVDTELIQSGRKLEGLHGLRAAAAIAVVLFHLHVLLGVPEPAWLAAVTTDFYLSVQLFFVISAFSLFHSRRYAPARYPGYLVKRFFRIAPLYYVMLAWYVLRQTQFPGWGALLANLTFTFNLVPGLEVGIVNAGWSVGVEMMFYLLLPVLLVTLNGVTAFVLLYLAVALTSTAFWSLTTGLPGLREYYAYYSLLGSMPAFAAGLLAYRIFVTLDPRPRRKLWKLVFGVAFAVLLVLDYRDPLGLHWRAAGLYFAAWGLPFGLLCLWQALYPSAPMRAGAVQWVADRSFSIYLLHPVVLEWLWQADAFLDRHGVAGAALLRPIGLVAGVALLFVIADVTYRYIELPGIAAGRRLAVRIDATVGAPGRHETAAGDSGRSDAPLEPRRRGGG